MPLRPLPSQPLVAGGRPRDALALLGFVGAVGSPEQEKKAEFLFTITSNTCVCVPEYHLQCFNTAFTICRARASSKPYFLCCVFFFPNSTLSLRVNKRKLCPPREPEAAELLPKRKRKKS